MPRPASSCSWSQKSRRAFGSTPAVGSSSSRSCGSCSRHAASARRCFQPPESSPASWFARSARPSRSSAPSTRASHVVHRVHPRDEAQVLADRQVLPQRESLRHVADVALDRLRLAPDVEAEARPFAAVGRQQPAQHPDRRGLAAAVGTEEAEDLAAAHGQREILDHVVVAEALVEAAHVDDDLAGHGARAALTTRAASRRPAGPDAACRHRRAPASLRRDRRASRGFPWSRAPAA